MLAISSGYAHAQSQEEYQQKLTELTESIKALKAELSKTKDSKDSLQTSLQQSEENIAELTKKIATIKEALGREKKRLSQLQTQRAELVLQQKQQQQQIAAAIQQSYRMGQQSRLKLLLNQQDPNKISRLVKYHDYIVESHQQDIKRYAATLDKLKSNEQAVTSTTKQLQEQQGQLSKRQSSLQASQKKRLATLRELKRSIAEKGQELSALSVDRNHLQDLLDEATNALANLALPENVQPFANTRGKLPKPTKGKILYRFGSSQFGGKLKSNGIFIRNNTGAEVVSVHHGRVIFSDYLRGHGLLLIIDHGNGYMSLYGHNQTLLKEIGDWASTGETIATIGNSGGQEQAGLYFEIRHKGQPQNPQLWLTSG